MLLLSVGSLATLRAQNTFGISQGFGWGSVRAYPSIESKPVYGLSTTSLMWRNYTDNLYVGCFGIDVEYMQRGFAYAPYTSENNTDDDKKASDLLYYYRYINTIMVPIIWQPYIYMFHNKVRVFGDAAVTLSYNFSSTYKNDLYNSYGYDDPAWQGDYEMRYDRDNKFGYGLAFGGGITYLFNRLEVQASMRYYFGYSDILKNRTIYYDNTTDGPDNPFSLTPQRSPLDNFNFKVGVSYRIGSADGYAAWYTKRIKRARLDDGFGYQGDDQSGSNKNSSGRSSGNQNQNGPGQRR